MAKTKVKVIRSSAHIYDDYDQMSSIYPVSTDWEEMTLEEAEEVRDAVGYANSKRDGSCYIFIEYNENVKNEVFRLASQFKEKLERDRKADEKKREEAKRKRDEKAVERKRKQLEKLKKELGDD